MYSRRLQISGITLEFQTQLPLVINEGFDAFLAEGEPDYVISCREAEDLGVIPKSYIYEGISYSVTGNTEAGFRRWFRDVRNGNTCFGYAVYDWGRKRIRIRYLPAGRMHVQELKNCFLFMAWEALLMHEKRIMLHSACVQTPLGTLLFAGPSGAGKSTQADLWLRYGGGRLINGDRTVLHREPEGWIGYGSPYAGSSHCYVNEGHPVRAIVFVRQAESCAVRRLASAEAFKKIFSCMTVNSWDREFVSFAADTAMRLAEELPVCEFSCTPDEDAVDALREWLAGEK